MFNFIVFWAFSHPGMTEQASRLQAQRISELAPRPLNQRELRNVRVSDRIPSLKKAGKYECHSFRVILPWSWQR